MKSRLTVLVLVLLVLPGILLAAGTGKIKGRVTDKETKEALIGASVALEGTSQGAVTDANGDYVILNVATGTYTVKVSYVGYQAISISNIRVNTDLTSEANVELPAVGVTVPTVEITAERPLVNKNATNAVRIIDNEFFEKLPERGVDAAVALQPGVVVENQNIYIRGGRLDETGFQVSGVPVNDVLFGGRGAVVSAEALEQTQVQAGGYNAEYGGANAGIISSQFRTGTAEGWKASFIGETDNFAGQGSKALGTYSYGYSDYTATFGGPLYGKELRFFGSVENTFYRDPGTNAITPSPTVWDGFSFSGQPTGSIITPSHRTPQIDSLNLVYQPGNLYGGLSNMYNFSTTLLYDGGQFQVRGAGSYSTQTSQDPAGVAEMFDSFRDPLHIRNNGLANLKFTHTVSSKTFYEVNVNYYNNYQVDEDPVLKGNIDAYYDSAASAAYGYAFKSAYVPLDPWSIYNGAPEGFTIFQPGTPIMGSTTGFGTAYNKVSQIGWGGRADVTSQYELHELKAGFEYERYEVRRFSPGLNDRAKYWDEYKSGQITYNDLVVGLRNSGGGMDNYGYDVFGNPLDNDVLSGTDVTDYGPRHPEFGAFYLQDKIEFSDLTVNAGLRFDYINSDGKTLRNPNNILFNDSLNLISSSNLDQTPITRQVSPRIGFSFPVTDRTVFHAQFGKYIQQSRLRDAYLGIGRSSNILKGGFFVQNVSGYGLEPERTTQYELGFSQQISDRAAFDATAFYKDIMNQIQWALIVPAAGATQGTYPAFVNGDFATSEGLEATLTLRRTQRIQAQLNYTFSSAKSTGTNSTSLAGAAYVSGFIPKYIFNSTFNQTHRGSILFDYRFGRGDGGPVLERLGLNLLGSFNSGHNFTLEQIPTASGINDPRDRVPLEEIGGSTTPWFFQLDGRLDKSVQFSQLDVNFYIYVQNILGTDNAVNVFPRTGDPRDDGWLSTPNGIADQTIFGANYPDVYRGVVLGGNSLNFGPPRQIRFGIKIDY